MIDRPARPDRPAKASSTPAGSRLPARLRGRRPLLVPPALDGPDGRR